MKYLLFALFALSVSSCASKSGPVPVTIEDTVNVSSTHTQEPLAQVVQPDNGLFQEAHRCQGIVKYQAEMQKGQIRSRLSCEWTVVPNEWGTW